jgi:hypothetical protein
MMRTSLVAKIKIIFIALFICAVPVVLNAQTNFDQTEPDGGQVSDSPIDGGVVLLLVAGTSLGALKIYKIKKQSKISKAI